jgi:hypothetical protein
LNISADSIQISEAILFYSHEIPRAGGMKGPYICAPVVLMMLFIQVASWETGTFSLKKPLI